MDAERYQQVKAVLDAALELEPDKRSAFLAEKCADDPELRAAVEALLIAHDKAQSFLEHGGAGATTTVTVKGPDGTPEQIGPYKILEKLGEGGMGMVYLAEQEHVLRRLVVLKTIKWGMDTTAVVARFEAERQALALMNHPNIVRVYDAGGMSDGRPYLVMEHIEGVPITDYCDRHRLSIANRLRLMIRVCQAVQHAHNRGIVHRDLKPSNILVSTPDEEPFPRIVDFGVALDRRGVGLPVVPGDPQRTRFSTIYTHYGGVVGTPAYMSPEQAEMTVEAVDHRTDIYSLGVILYELLVGELPLKWDPRSVSLDEIRVVIRDTEPQSPSIRLSQLAFENVRRLAASRRTTLRHLRGEYSEQLDWITIRALHKVRTNRYATAAELSADIERYLSNQEVTAAPLRKLSQIRKYLRRNRGLVAAAVSGFVTGLVLGFLL